MKEENKKDLGSMFKYLTRFSEIKYNSELKREDSLVQQASQMQTAFSFLIVAVFMVAALVIEHRKYLPLRFYFVSFSLITITLVFSLLFAMLAQHRRKQTVIPNVSTIRDYIYNHESEFETEEKQEKYLIDTYAAIQESKASNNDKRVKWIQRSMWFFYGAIGLCFLSFIVGICMILL